MTLLDDFHAREISVTSPGFRSAFVDDFSDLRDNERRTQMVETISRHLSFREAKPRWVIDGASERMAFPTDKLMIQGKTSSTGGVLCSGGTALVACGAMLTC